MSNSHQTEQRRNPAQLISDYIPGVRAAVEGLFIVLAFGFTAAFVVGLIH
ncbi:hypothetical protein ABFT80_12205 [Mesorhizobium sp. SB112]